MMIKMKTLLLDQTRVKRRKRRNGKEIESSKKPLTPKESSRGKPPSKPSKFGKSRSANDPFPDANTEQPSPDVAANSKRQKNDWYKKSPSPEPQDPDWNTIKRIGIRSLQVQ
ncbi:hypothetical protein Tco_0361652, partial [Tanacetum coccineum]